MAPVSLARSPQPPGAEAGAGHLPHARPASHARPAHAQPRGVRAQSRERHVQDGRLAIRVLPPAGREDLQDPEGAGREEAEAQGAAAGRRQQPG